MLKSNTENFKKSSFQTKYTQNKEIKKESSQPTSNWKKTSQSISLNQNYKRGTDNSEQNMGNPKKYTSSQKNIFNNDQKKNEFLSISSIRNKYQAPEDKNSLNTTSKNNYISLKNKRESYFSSKVENNKEDSNIKKNLLKVDSNLSQKDRNKIIPIYKKINGESTSTQRPIIIKNSEKNVTEDKRKNNYDSKPSYQSNSKISKTQIQINTSQIKNAQNQNEPSLLKNKYASNYKYNNSSSNLKNNNSINIQMEKSSSYKYESNSNSRKNIYVPSSTQSNSLMNKNQNNNYRTNQNLYNKDEPKISNNLKKINLLNKNQLTSNNLRANSDFKKKYEEAFKSQINEKDKRSYSSMSHNTDNSRKNTVLHSIVETRNTPKKPYVLNVRKTEIIRYERRHRRAYNDSMSGDNQPIINNENHKLYERRNVTKERKTVADLTDDEHIVHRYNYNTNPNLSNTGVISINVSNKKPKKEYVLSPRKNEIIQSERHNKRTYNVVEPQERIKKYTLLTRKHDNTNNYKNNNDSKNTYEQKINKNSYEPKNNKNAYEPKYNKISNETKTNKNTYELKYKRTSEVTKNNKNDYEQKYKKNSNEPKNNKNTYELKYNKNSYEPKTNNNKYESKYNKTNENEL